MPIQSLQAAFFDLAERSLGFWTASRTQSICHRTSPATCMAKPVWLTRVEKSAHQAACQASGSPLSSLGECCTFIVPAGMQAQPLCLACMAWPASPTLSIYPAGTLSPAGRSPATSMEPCGHQGVQGAGLAARYQSTLACRDSIIYSAFCDRIGDAPVAIKVYNKAKLSTSKLRAIKREAAMMIYMSRKK